MRNSPRNPALDAIPRNLMVELDERKAALRRAGRKLHDFGLGDPQEPTPPFLREALRAAVPEVSQYPSPLGTPALRGAVAGYLARRFGVTVDPDRQVVPATGAKESIFHLPLAFRGGPRRKVILPDPGYPTYEAGARLAGLEPVKVPLRAANRFLLEPEDLPPGAARRDAALLGELPAQPHRRRGAARLPRARRAGPPGATASSWPPTSATPTSGSTRRRSPCSRSRSRTCSPSTPARSAAA